MAAVPLVSGIPTIEAVGSKFFTSDGNQFYIKGIAYQLTENDPLVNGDQCQQDAQLMKTLGANAIRVYHVSASGNHDACMQAFSDAGIYAFVDLDTFNTYILGTDPYWNQTQFNDYAAVLDTFQKYDNLAGVFVGNEVLEQPMQSSAAVYVKAAARDMKAYRDSKGYRNIPIGYSAADIASLRPMLQDYLVCGGNASQTIDFFSLNAYEWCGASSYQVSGYDNLQSQAAGYPVPIFFSETGCNTSPPRTFADQAAIFGPNMVNTWSGAIIYEWIEEANNYGLVSYGSGTPTPISPDFTNLKSAWATLTPTGVARSAYTASTSGISTPACPSASAGGWGINGNPAIPSIGQAFDPTGSQVASATNTASGTGSGPSGSASASAKTGSVASEGKGVAMGMALSLGAVMVGFVVWL